MSVHPCGYMREPLRVGVRRGEDRRRTFFDRARTSKGVARTLRSLGTSLKGRTPILQGSSDTLYRRRETLGASSAILRQSLDRRRRFRATLGDRRLILRESSAIAGGQWRNGVGRHTVLRATSVSSAPTFGAPLDILNSSIDPQISQIRADKPVTTWDSAMIGLCLL